MAFAKELVRAGAAQTLAAAIGGSVATGLTAAGSTQATALALTSVVNVIGTAAASTGVIIPGGLQKGDTIYVRNGGANTLAVYPPVGGTVDGGSANAALSVATTKNVMLVCLGDNGLDFIAFTTA